jgi:hypothetical protein
MEYKNFLFHYFYYKIDFIENEFGFLKYVNIPFYICRDKN